MLRRRIEKLELHRSRSSSYLVRDLDRQAVARLSPEDRQFVAGRQNSGRRARPPQKVEAANNRYQEALAELLTVVSLEEINSMIAFCEPSTGDLSTMEAL